MARVNSSPVEAKPIVPIDSIDQVEKPVKIEAETVKKITPEIEVKRVVKTIEKKTVEKKPAAI